MNDGRWECGCGYVPNFKKIRFFDNVYPCGFLLALLLSLSLSLVEVEVILLMPSQRYYWCMIITRSFLTVSITLTDYLVDVCVCVSIHMKFNRLGSFSVFDRSKFQFWQSLWCKQHDLVALWLAADRHLINEFTHRCCRNCSQFTGRWSNVGQFPNFLFIPPFSSSINLTHQSHDCTNFNSIVDV